MCHCNPICRDRDDICGMFVTYFCVIILLPVLAVLGIIALPIYLGVHFVKEKLPSDIFCECARFFFGIFAALLGIPVLYVGLVIYGIFLVIKFLVLVLCCNCSCPLINE